MGKQKAPSDFRFTIELLKDYCKAALQNASELLAEASLLHDNNHNARAYFLASAAMEETGKAMLAFDGQGRNLRDSAITRTLLRVMEDHSTKISAAFSPTLNQENIDQATIMKVVNLMIALTHGREPSMYTDIDYGSSKVQIPAAMVRKVATRDCVSLSESCLALARAHVSSVTPKRRSHSKDVLFVMKEDQRKEVFNSEDFWRYYIAELQSSKKDWAIAMAEYWQRFMSKGKRFQNLAGHAEGSA